MIRKILVYENALADKHPAFQRALLLAKHAKTEFKIVDVAEGTPDNCGDLHRPMRSVVEQERKDRLDAICQALRDLGMTVTTELLHGRPFVAIVREVVHDGFHLVIKTAASASPTDVLGMMGPVDMRLVRNCPCPVWLESPCREVRCERILVAIDPQAEDDDLNKVLLEMGVSLAKAAEAELRVVSAWEVPDEDFLTEIMKPEKLARYTKDTQSAAQERLDALLFAAGIPVKPNAVRFRKGSPAGTVLDCVESLQPDIVVMGTVGHTNVRGLLIGNTADTVLRQINCSVLAVKPSSLFRA